MRYILVDRFLEIEKGVRARAVKCVTLGEPFLNDLPAYPNALVLEALIQAGGILTRASSDFARPTVLGKVDTASFAREAMPGDTIQLEVEILLARDEGNLCEGIASVNGEEIARARYLIIYVPADKLPPPDAGVAERRMRLMKALGVVSEEA
ncbi:MAG: 3-hydroxyacyl-[acyl-carrier-protein] dehydratase FabZ [Planctomycetota bacterium]